MRYLEEPFAQSIFELRLSLNVTDVIIERLTWLHRCDLYRAGEGDLFPKLQILHAEPFPLEDGILSRMVASRLPIATRSESEDVWDDLTKHIPRPGPQIPFLRLSLPFEPSRHPFDIKYLAMAQLKGLICYEDKKIS